MPETAIAPKPDSVSGRGFAGQRGLRWLRFISLFLGATAMALGLWTGLDRLGALPLSGTFPPAELHGAFMVGGFLGTVISLERAVAIGRWWAYGAPAISAAGALALTANFGRAGAFAFIVASAILLIATVSVALRKFAMFVAVLATGASCWMVGAVLWLNGHSISEVTGWWLNFLILTVAAERLELSRILRVSPANQVLFFLFALLPLIGAARVELLESWGPFTSVGFIGLASWLLRHDVARTTIRFSGLPKFSAWAILTGHVWLGVAGVIVALMPFEVVVASYDAAVHAIAVGFVMSMIFGHAPIILPAVTGLRVRFSTASYLSLALLHVSMLLRLIGDIAGLPEVRAASGILTVLAMIGYAATLVAASARQNTRAR